MKSTPQPSTRSREEADELRDAEPQERIGELADLLEVVKALAAHHGHDWDDVVAAAAAKASSWGEFEGRLWLEETTR